MAQQTSRSAAATDNESIPEVRLDDDQDLENLSEVVMAVNLTDRGAVGCAYYVAQTETLYFMEDAQMSDAAMVESCESPLLMIAINR